jgi:flagellar basal-body rod protein FlgC
VRLGPVVAFGRGTRPDLAPDHPMADETGHYDGSNVNLVIEIADAREAQRSYEANLRIYEQTRQMSQSLLDILRR